MRKKYDDFTQLKLKDMSKTISDMTFKYINPESGEPTKVPSTHYEEILNEIEENYLSTVTSRQMLTVMYSQLQSLRKEDQRYFDEALLCIDLGINPKDMRLPEQVAFNYTSGYLEQKQNLEKKKFHYLSNDVVETYNNALNDPEIQAMYIRESDKLSSKNNRNHDFER